jgi:Uma2 family endonuclease
MSPTALKSTPVTASAFLTEPDRGPPGKKYLVDGVVYAMAPASPTHGAIQAKLAILIGAHLLSNKLPCRVLTEAGVQPKIRAKTNVRIPDLIVTCEPIARPGDKLVKEPMIVIEVLSPSNDDDSYGSIMACSTLPSVKQMLVVDSSRVSVELWQRDLAGEWPTDPEPITSGSVPLAALGLDLALADVYADTHLSVGSTR